MLEIAFGALLGFVASLLTWYVQREAQRRDDAKHVEEERARVRLLLSEENAHNIASLKEFWRRCIDSSALDPRAGYGTDDLEFEHILRLVQLPLPAWNTHFWETLGAEIPHVLSESEIRGTFELNAQLVMFHLLREKIRDRFNQSPWERVRAEYTQLRRSKSDGKEPRDPMGQQYAQGIMSGVRQFNELVFSDFHGEINRLGCEGIQESVRNPIEEPVPTPLPTPVSLSHDEQANGLT